MKRNLFYIALVVLFVLPEHAFAWGQKGHRIVAEVAYRTMKPSTRRKVDAVLGRNGMVYWANWADEIRSDSIYPSSSTWHYQDFPGGMSDSAVVATLTDYPDPKTGMLWRKTDSLVNVLRTNPQDRDALRFVVHFVADRFCPMHTAHVDDKGGNAVKMKLFEPTNLHAVWDSGIIEARGYSYTEYATYLIDIYGAERKTIQTMSEAEVVVRNYHAVEAIYAYQQIWNGNPYNYVYRWHATAEYNLYAAGVRLAKLLEELY